MTLNRLIGVVAGVAMLCICAGSYAQGTDTQDKSTQDKSATAGQDASTSGSVGGAAGMQQVEGRVIKADSKAITIEHQGAAIPLEVRKGTTFQGVKSAKEIKEGQQVRASFELKKDKNELTSVELLGGGGGQSPSESGGTKSESGKSDTGKTY